ncbi:MAG: cation:dicarboxylase symporter family transporter [Proteobacteria bacterium]|nr:cation:dicarboxylase symporter family transporter [Pseudomonadota bacterium]
MKNVLTKVLSNKNNVFLLSILLGIYFALYQKWSLGIFSIISGLYLAGISFTIIPIIFSLLVCSIISLLNPNLKLPVVKTILSAFFMLFFSTAFIVSVAAFWVFLQTKYHIDASIIDNLKHEPHLLYLNLSDSLFSSENVDFGTFLLSLVPKNIFNSFSSGNQLQIFTTAVLIGVSIGLSQSSSSENVVISLRKVNDVFSNILAIVLRFLPLGLTAIIVTSLAKVDISIFATMIPFIKWLFISFLFVLFGVSLMIRFYCKKSVFRFIADIKQAIIVAASTSSAQASLPSLLLVFKNEFGFNAEKVDSLVPLLLTICRVSNACYFAFISVFIASVYAIPLNITHYLFIILGSIIASLATAGMSGLLAISMVTLILNPLGIPVGELLSVLLILEPLVDPIRSALSVIAVSALSHAILQKS